MSSQPSLTLDQLVPGVTFPRHNENLTLEELDLTQAILSGCIFKNCTFRKVSFSRATLHGAQFFDCLFEDCNLSHSSGRGVLLQDCKFVGGSLYCAELLFSEFKCTTFVEVEAVKANLVNTCCGYCTFQNSRLLRASLIFSHILETYFRGCDFKDMDLHASFVGGCTFRECDLEGVIVDGVQGFHPPEGWEVYKKGVVMALTRKKA